MNRAAALLAALVVAATAGAAAAKQDALDRTVAALFRPYSRPTTLPAPPVWERPIWSRETAALIARWRKVTPQDEVDELSDGDWLCQCQDWDEHAFRMSIESRKIDAPGHAFVQVKFRLDTSGWRSERLSMRQERGTWKIDDLFGEDFPSGLKAALRRTIAEDSRQ